MSHNRGLTMVEALVLMFAITLLLAMFLPASFGTSRTSSRRMQNNTQLRGIHQAMVMYAQGNAGHFPGLDHTGGPAAIAVEDRLWILLDNNYFTPEYVISPLETANKHPWTAGPFTRDHYSYAMLQVPAAGGRHDEWHETLNPDAIVLSDRNTGTVANPESILSNQPVPSSGTFGCSWTQRRYGPDWQGGIVRNDNSVSLESTHLHDTDYAGHAHVDDHLFEAAGDDDAYLIHSGN